MDDVSAGVLELECPQVKGERPMFLPTKLARGARTLFGAGGDHVPRW